MKRPWELGRMQERRGGPRVYVPVSLPDTTSTSFAVLELVGFSSSPDSSQICMAPPLQQRTLTSSPIYQVPNSPPSCQFLTNLDSPNSATHEPPLPSHTQNSMKTQAESSVEGPPDPIIPCLASTPPTLLPSMLPSSVTTTTTVAMDGKVHVIQTGIKENVVHTTSFNFKDVVQKLTGASPHDTKFMPVTMPYRPIVASNGGRAPPKKVLDALSIKVDASKGLKKAPPKLHERRKALNNLERLCTDKHLSYLESLISPSLSSPMSHLASYFEMFCNAVTPTNSKVGCNGSSPPPRHLTIGSMTLNTPIIESCARNDVVEHVTHAPSRGGVQALNKIHQHCASLVGSLQNPSLLSLFPESPLYGTGNLLSTLP